VHFRAEAMDLNRLEHRYGQLGVGSQAQNATALYLDMVKRAVCNLIYEDAALWRYDRAKTLSCGHWGGETARVSRRSSRPLPGMGCSMSK
jgi:hypothetical protein